MAMLWLGGCDIPTEAPVLENRLIIPAEATSFGIEELLPAEIAVSGTSFVLALRDTLRSRTLSELCAAPCALVPAGMTIAPKPAFTADVDFAVVFPADVQSAVLSGGALRLELAHDFGFDPLAGGGYLHTLVTSGGRVVARDSAAVPFAPGTVLVRDLPLAAGPLSGELQGVVTIVSPRQSGPVTYDPAATLSVRVRPGASEPVRISEATVRRPTTVVNALEVELDLTRIDDAIGERARAATIVADLTNPFNAGGTLTLQIRVGPHVLATRAVTLPPCTAATPCTTRHRVDPAFTAEQIRNLIGRNVIMAVTGALDAGDAFITVRPDQQLDMRTQLDVTLRIGDSQH